MAGQSKAINFFYPALFLTGNFLQKKLFKNSKTWKLSGFSKVFHMPKVTPKNNKIHQIFIF
jgi:hypothetical protein